MEKSVENVIQLLVASFRGTNEEVKLSTQILSSFYQDPEFPSILLSILQQKSHELKIRQSAAIQLIILLRDKIIPIEALPSFISHFSETIESSEIQMTPILKKTSNLLFSNLYDNACFTGDVIVDNISPFIFESLSLNHYKSSLIYAMSFIKLISTNLNNSKFFYSSFTSNYIAQLSQLIPHLYSFEKMAPNFQELISLIFHFLSRCTEYCLPEIFTIPDNLQFWMPSSMTTISFDRHHYLKFLSNLPKFLSKVKESPPFKILIDDIALYAQNSILDVKSNLLSIKLLYKLLYFDLIGLNDDFLPILLKAVILPQFTLDNVIETYNSDLEAWNDPHYAAISLFEKLLQKDQRIIQLLYSVFQSENFQDVSEAASTLDLISFSTTQFYEFDPETFCSFLNALGSIIESNEYLTIAFLKVLSKIKANQPLPPEFLLNAATFSFEHLPITDDSLVSYFSALSLSSLVTQIKHDEELTKLFLEKVDIQTNFQSIFEAFFTFERDYQTQDVTCSLKKLISFFGPLISPLLMEITNEIVGFFFFFSSNKDIAESSMILSSIIRSLIEISNGDINFCNFLIDLILNPELISNIQYEPAYDNINDILSEIVFHSTEFSEKFLQIVPFVVLYLTRNDSSNFDDVSNLVELIIWKYSMNPESDISILISFLVEYLNTSIIFQDWVICASLAIRIPQLAESYEMEFIFPKLLFFLNENSKCFDHFKFAYMIIEHCIQYHFDEILHSYASELDFIFKIYLNYSRYPSFLDSIVKIFPNIPDSYKPAALQTAIQVAMNKNNSEYDEYFDEEEEFTEVPKVNWFNENEIIANFIAFCNQLLLSFPDFQGRDLIEKFVQQSE